MSEHLDAFERARLARAEKTIRKGLKTFVAVGSALLEIRDNRLYRDGYDSFDAYCRDKWSLSATHGNRLIQAAEVVRTVAPIGAVPQTESQARELAPLLDDRGLMRRAWAAVVHRTGGKPTAKDVREVVHETIQTPADPGATPEPGPAGRGALADARGEARAAGDTPSTEPPAHPPAGEGGPSGHRATGAPGRAPGPEGTAQTEPPAACQRAGEGDGPAGGRAGRSVSGPRDASQGPRPGVPTDPLPDPQPVSPPSAGPESGGQGAPSSSPQVDGADGAPPSARPVAEGGAAEPLLIPAEIHEALTDPDSPLYLPDFGCRLALVHANEGAPLDRAVVGAFRQTLGVA